MDYVYILKTLDKQFIYLLRNYMHNPSYIEIHHVLDDKYEVRLYNNHNLGNFNATSTLSYDFIFGIMLVTCNDDIITLKNELLRYADLYSKYNSHILNILDIPLQSSNFQQIANNTPKVNTLDDINPLNTILLTKSKFITIKQNE